MELPCGCCWRPTGGNPAGRMGTWPPALYSPWRELGVNGFFLSLTSHNSVVLSPVVRRLVRHTHT